jgi:glycosyltransferase involved in cell wall biosynthesis
VLDFLKQEQLSCDTVYFNSLFSVKYTILPLLFYRNYKVQKILAPRGMLGHGALKIKPIKKRIFLFASKKFLFRDVIWHASTQAEAKEVRHIIGRTAEAIVAQNISLPATKKAVASDFKTEQKLKLVFISRISEKKNIGFLLSLLRSMEKMDGLTLDIYGPIEDQEYWTKCYALFENDDRVQYKGVINPVEVNSVLANYHFFVLPTLHENYGHSIVEAINCGLPVMISQRTPWRNLKVENVGFDISLNAKETWMEALRVAYFMGGANYIAMTEACYQYATTHFLSENIIAQNKKLFLNE